MKGCPLGPLEEIGHVESKYHINYLEMLAVYLGLQVNLNLYLKIKPTRTSGKCVITPLQSTLLTIWEPVIQILVIL